MHRRCRRTYRAERRTEVGLATTLAPTKVEVEAEMQKAILSFWCAVWVVCGCWNGLGEGTTCSRLPRLARPYRTSTNEKLPCAPCGNLEKRRMIDQSDEYNLRLILHTRRVLLSSTRYAPRASDASAPLALLYTLHPGRPRSRCPHLLLAQARGGRARDGASARRRAERGGRGGVRRLAASRVPALPRVHRLARRLRRGARVSPPSWTARTR